jgi:sugar phosphate isomerase/epimerase
MGSTIIAGLVSITFRHLSPEAIVDLCLQNGLETIEWGGDVHVPHGDLSRARDVGEATRAAGLEVAAYGSYYRFGDLLAGAEHAQKSTAPGPSFQEVLETALALGASIVRIWAGDRGSRESSPEARAVLARAAREYGDRAAKEGVELCFEYHRNTLTDTVESAASLLEEIDHPAVNTLWQPSHLRSPKENRRALRSVISRVRNVHLFSWGPGGSKERLPLQSDAEAIRGYLSMLQETGGAHAALLEFVKGDDPEQLAEDAKTLRALLGQL